MVHLQRTNQTLLCFRHTSNIFFFKKISAKTGKKIQNAALYKVTAPIAALSSPIKTRYMAETETIPTTTAPAAISRPASVNVSQLTTIAGFTTSQARVATILSDATTFAGTLNGINGIKDYNFIRGMRALTYYGANSSQFRQAVPDAATRNQYIGFVQQQARNGVSRQELSTTLGANYHLEGINNTMTRYGFDTRVEQANFLSQMAVESAGFRASREYASGAAYEGRDDLGNTQPGDGVRFAGRGLMQLTGRDVYGQYGNYVGIDAINNPTMLEREPYASDAAGYFVNNYKAYANLHQKMEQPDNVPAITRVINGGRTGLPERQSAYTRAMRVLPSTEQRQENRPVLRPGGM